MLIKRGDFRVIFYNIKIKKISFLARNDFIFIKNKV